MPFLVALGLLAQGFSCLSPYLGAICSLGVSALF
jgi:hypothetical protein